MALPKVTPGTYDYGAYAKPTMVKYKGGQQAIGKAIGAIVSKGVELKKQKQAEIKAADDWKSNEVYELYTAVPSDVVASNEEGLKSLTDNMGELGKLKALGKISGEEYNKRMIPLKRTYDAYMVLGTDLYNAIGDQPLNLTKYKGEELNSAAGLHRAISSGALEIKFDPKTSESIASWTGADGKEKFSTDLVDLTVNSKKYLKLNERYDINSADNQKIFSDAGKVLNQNNFVDNFMTGVINTAEGSKAALDKQGLVDALADPNNNFINPIVEQNGKDIFEDIVQQIKPGLEFESDEAQSLIRSIIASQIADKTKQVGDKIPEPKAEPKPDKPAKWEIDMAELKQEQEKLVTNPISQRQWDSVIKPRPSKSYEGGVEGQSTASLDDMSLTAMSQLASKYDFTIVGEPLLDKSGTKEIGFELQDNKTKEKVRIYKSFSIDQVMEELKKAKNVSDSNKVRLP